MAARVTPRTQTAPLGGLVDIARRERVSGWAQDPAAPNVPVSLLITTDDTLLVRVLADRLRADLRAAGIGAGRHAFDVELEGLSPLSRHVIAVRRESDGVHLQGSPVILAEGAWSKTLVDDDSRLLFDNAADYQRRYPGSSARPALFCAPRITGGYRLEAIRQRLGERAGTRTPRRMLRLKGHIDCLSPSLIAGWAQTPEHPEAPVCLDIFVGDVLIACTLANRYRADLESAGLGSGRHAFRVRLPSALSDEQRRAVKIRRPLDGALLAA